MFLILNFFFFNFSTLLCTSIVHDQSGYLIICNKSNKGRNVVEKLISTIRSCKIFFRKWNEILMLPDSIKFTLWSSSRCICKALSFLCWTNANVLIVYVERLSTKWSTYKRNVILFHNTILQRRKQRTYLETKKIIKKKLR